MKENGLHLSHEGISFLSEAMASPHTNPPGATAIDPTTDNFLINLSIFSLNIRMESLEGWEDEKTPVQEPGPSEIDIEVCNRLIFNEVGYITCEEDAREATALVYALSNLSEKSRIYLAKLLTGREEPTDKDFANKYRIFRDGRVALLGTLYPAREDNEILITSILNGITKDPLYGEWMFFNRLEEECPEYYRDLWDVGEEFAEKTGLIFGKFEFSPVGFFEARANGRALFEHVKNWEKQRDSLV